MRSSRLHDHGKAKHDKCLLCGSLPGAGSSIPEVSGTGHRGTLWHRHYECDAHRSLREHAASVELRAAARRVAAVGEAHAERFARGVVPDPHSLVPWVNEPLEDMVQWANGKVPEGGGMSGLIFIDGSGLHPSQPPMRRAGWAVVQVDRFGNMQFGAYIWPSALGRVPAADLAGGRGLCSLHAHAVGHRAP